MKSYSKNLQASQNRLGLILLGMLGGFLMLISTTSYAEVVSDLQPVELTPTEEQDYHSKLVITALKTDFFNKRCRGISVAKSFNKVNRLFINKYSLTANNYIKLYINPDVRQEKQQQEREFKKSLNSIGGCSKARKLKWRNTLNKEFDELYQQAETSTWYPEEN